MRSRYPIKPVIQAFKNLLQDQLVRFSHHAEVRLNSEAFNYSRNNLDKIGTAIDKAAAKGAKDSLMLMVVWHLSLMSLIELL